MVSFFGFGFAAPFLASAFQMYVHLSLSLLRESGTPIADLYLPLVQLEGFRLNPLPFSHPFVHLSSLPPSISVDHAIEYINPALSDSFQENRKLLQKRVER